jgi:serralysin
MAIKRGTNLSEVLDGTSDHDTIYGYGGHDVLSGLAGDDSLFGGAGDDDLIGGTGVNDYWGGSGYDWFIMSQRTTAGFSDDVIYDFTFDVDQIDVSAWGVSDFSQILALLSTDGTDSATLNAYFAGHDHVLTIDGVAPDDLVSRTCSSEGSAMIF